MIDWDKLHGIIIYILFAASLVGLVFMFTLLWISV
jgi:hypothetical protein